MPLISLEQLLPDLVCPRCRHILNRDVDGFHCSAGDCPFVTPGSFATVDGRPVLIDFQESILDPAWVMASGGKSIINRAGKGSLKQRVKSVLFPINPVSQTNAERFAEQLREHGVDANATLRRTRGVTKRYPGQGVTHMLSRG